MSTATVKPLSSTDRYGSEERTPRSDGSSEGHHHVGHIRVLSTWHGLQKSTIPVHEAPGMEIPLGVSGNDYCSALGAGYLTQHLKERRLVHSIEESSVYGAALAIPQIARSSGWSSSMMILVFRVHLVLVLNFAVQFGLLHMVSKENEVWSRFSGKMNLCDFGGSTSAAHKMIGPGGTAYSESRIMTWTTWSNKMFLKDSLKAIFPDKAHIIEENVDPGEYGLENHSCRLLCCMIFTLTLTSDLWSALDVLYILCCVPNKAEPWLSYEVPSWGDKNDVKTIKQLSELDFIQIKIAGIPVVWKLMTVLFIIIPRLLLWRATAYAGISFIMETPDITSLIVNCTALSFILRIAEMLEEVFASEPVKWILNRVQPFETDEPEILDFNEIYKRQLDQEMNTGFFHRIDLNLLFPRRAFIVVLATAYYIWDYYQSKCTLNPDGTYVSQSMYLPVSAQYSFWSFIFPKLYPNPEASEPYWEMPESAHGP